MHPYHTYFIDHGVAIGEAPSWAAIEINAIGEIVGLGKRGKIIVISIVNERVSEYKHSRYHLHLSPAAAVAISEWTVSTSFKLGNTYIKQHHPHNNHRDTVNLNGITHHSSTLV